MIQPWARSRSTIALTCAGERVSRLAIVVWSKPPLDTSRKYHKQLQLRFAEVEPTWPKPRAPGRPGDPRPPPGRSGRCASPPRQLPANPLLSPLAVLDERIEKRAGKAGSGRMLLGQVANRFSRERFASAYFGTKRFRLERLFAPAANSSIARPPTPE